MLKSLGRRQSIRNGYVSQKPGRRGGWRDRITILSRIKALPKYLKDRNVPTLKKAGIIGMVVYILSPVDALPEIIIPLVGWLDDLGVLAILSTWMYGELGSYREREIEANEAKGMYGRRE